MKKQTTKKPGLKLKTTNQPSTGEPVPNAKNSFLKGKKDMEEKIRKGNIQHEKVVAAGNLPVKEKPMSIKTPE